MQQEWINALIGGVIIGIAVSLMLFLNGRITGISGIVNEALLSLKTKEDSRWRYSFILGLILGGFFLMWYQADSFLSVFEAEWPMTLVAGIFVGFGTVMGGGCTSGHGVCGISRLSLRSIVATILFIFAGVATVGVLR